VLSVSHATGIYSGSLGIGKHPYACKKKNCASYPYFCRFCTVSQSVGSLGVLNHNCKKSKLTRRDCLKHIDPIKVFLNLSKIKNI